MKVVWLGCLERRLRLPEQTDVVMSLVRRGNLDEVKPSFFKTGDRFDLHAGAQVIGRLAVLVGGKRAIPLQELPGARCLEREDGVAELILRRLERPIVKLTAR